MGELKPDALRKQLKSGELSRCYIFYGKENYLREHYSRELRKAVLGAEDDPFNLHRFDGKDLDLQALSDAVDAYPSFAERSLVEVRDYDIFHAAEGDSEKLQAILRDLPDYCCLVFSYDSLEFKQDRRKKQLCDTLKQHAALVDFPAQESGELVRWIQRHFAARQKEISTEDAKYLIFLCGSLMDGLNNEIGKIALYAKDTTVTRADIDAVASPVVEAEAFRLADALAGKKYEAAAELMGKLFHLNTEPISINAMIASQLRKMYAALLVKRTGGSVDTLKELLGAGSDYMPRQYLRICGAFSEDWYCRSLKLCAETDYQMKSTGADPNDLLLNLFLYLSARS